MWLNKLEEKFGRYAIPNLPKIIVLLYAVGFVIANISPRLYSLLELNPSDLAWTSLENCDIPVDRTRDEFDLCNICIVILLLDRKLIRASMGNIPIQYVLSDRSFRNDRWGIFNLCDPYIRIWRRLWSVC